MEEWRWVDEHIDRITPKIAGDEVRIIEKDDTGPEQEVTEQERDEKQTETHTSTTPPNEEA